MFLRQSERGSGTNRTNGIIPVKGGLRLIAGRNAGLADKPRRPGQATIRVQVPAQDRHQLIDIHTSGRFPAWLDLATNLCA